jgi:hypothetical protein
MCVAERPARRCAVRTLVLKENQILYEVVAQEAGDETIIIEHDGHPAYVLMPYAEYEALRASRQPQPVFHLDWSVERTLEDVVADIKRRGPGIPNVREPTASLAELLENSPHDPDFNLEEWTREWEKTNAEIEAEDERES